MTLCKKVYKRREKERERRGRGSEGEWGMDGKLEEYRGRQSSLLNEQPRDHHPSFASLKSPIFFFFPPRLSLDFERVFYILRNV